MFKFLRATLPVVLSSLLALTFSCSKKQEVTPAAAPTSAAVVVPARVGAITQAWFAGLHNSAGSRTTSAPPAINWEQATYSENYVVAPFADTLNPFAGVQKYGYRFLVVRMAPDSSCTGRIVELIVDQSPATPSQAASLALNGVKPLMTDQAPGLLKNFTGYLLAYSPAYEYQTGLIYTAGALQKVTAQINKVAQTVCYQYYLYATDNQGGTVFIQNLWNTCDGGIPSTGGGGGDGSTGGGSWGGTSTGSTGPAQTATIDQSQLVPCQSQVMQGLQSASGAALLGIVALFSGEDPEYNWVVKNGALPANTYGKTNPAFNLATHTATTIFDSSHWHNATDLAIARTILHEAIHAYLIAYFANSPTYANSPHATFGDMVTTFNNSLTGTYNTNSIHHYEMSQGGPSNGWIGDIAWSLKQYGIQQGYNLPDQFYMDMAWGGLADTAAFQALPSVDRTRILDTIATELTGKDDGGNPAIQSGTKTGC